MCKYLAQLLQYQPSSWPLEKIRKKHNLIFFYSISPKRILLRNFESHQKDQVSQDNEKNVSTEHYLHFLICKYAKLKQKIKKGIFNTLTLTKIHFLDIPI